MAILPGSRIRKDGVFGTTTDNPLTAGATTFNSARLADLPVVSGNHAIITLDPLRQFGNPEIIMVTSHTGAATVATIQRGMFGTTARSHPVGTLWVHAARQDDFIQIVTSGTRPTDQYEGQFIFESDTNKLMGFGGVDWAPRDAGGQLANGYAETFVAQTGIVALTDLTGLSVTVNVGTARRIKITGMVSLLSSVADTQILLHIREGGSGINFSTARPASANQSVSVPVIAIRTPSAGSHTYKLSCQRNAGTGSISTDSSAGFASLILVEDIGAA